MSQAVSVATTRLVPTLADRVVPRSAVANTLLILGGTAVVAVSAQISVPLWPVPVTGQTLAVLLVGASLGAWRGPASLALYLVAGLAGLPIFAEFTGGPASVFSPSFGFIIGFIPAAALIGWLSERAWDRRPVLAALGFLAASLVPFLFGLPYLGLMLARLGLPHDFTAVMAAGFTPFIIGGIVKWAIAAALLPASWALVRRIDKR
ncbi:biotin transporter BioY [Humibacter ginsenosidimutans]|uniref:Biotin transporter n=1 Tax=Humibacter ginsenosidimutans TaxID=2599293 RepID=A0A5B8M5A1_9MICO|nr:biotin transporter BioY [Humibacter ginsenosidimutans]QDZ15134.1 biotin transporter BioY [Humibacter ginsenosidimutans]